MKPTNEQLLAWLDNVTDLEGKDGSESIRDTIRLILSSLPEVKAVVKAAEMCIPFPDGGTLIALNSALAALRKKRGA